MIHDSNCRVALPGGEVYREQKLIVSPFEEDAIQHYSASRMFMSAIAIGPLGVIEGDPLIARAETKLLKRADKLIVLADSSKFVSRGSLVVCPLSRIAILITDRAAPPAALEMFQENPASKHSWSMPTCSRVERARSRLTDRRRRRHAHRNAG